MSATRGSTKMCSVLFAGIAGYSEKTHVEQIALKERFVALWMIATSKIPSNDVMVVDTGDGASMTALVEPEDSIRVALKLRELLVTEDPNFSVSMPLRMGINFGPIQLSTDVHGKPCAVGDVISVAQRIMGLAAPGQIVVSRSYYDVILPLSHRYEEMLHHLGKRTDQNARSYDVYGWGTASQVATPPRAASPAPAPKPRAEWSPPKRSLASRMLGWLLGLLRNIFFLIRFAVLLIVIYEIITLVPIMKQPDSVRQELNSQIAQARSAWAGLKTAAKTLGSATEESPPQKSHKASTHPPQRSGSAAKPAASDPLTQ